MGSGGTKSKLNRTSKQINFGVDKLSKLSDQELADFVNKSKNMDLPNYLNDVDDPTQRFVFAAKLNEKPVVLEDADLDQFMKDNNLTKENLLSRDVTSISLKLDGKEVNYTANDIIDMMKYDKYNYVGGKHGGQQYGAGTYFGHSQGKGMGYYSSEDSNTAIAVLNPKTAKVISYHDLKIEAEKFNATHPKFKSL